MVPATFAGELDVVPASAESSVLEQGSFCSQQGWKVGSVHTGPSPGAACPHLLSAFLGMLPLRQLASLGARGWGGGLEGHDWDEGEWGRLFLQTLPASPSPCGNCIPVGHKSTDIF